MKETTIDHIHIDVEPTPNPNALKFIVNKDVRIEGKVSFKMPSDCQDVPLASALFDLRGVDQIHFFQNVVTVSKFSFEPWDELEHKIIAVIQKLMPQHDANFLLLDPELERRKMLGPELLRIEEILDKKIRPGLQGDGGDLICVDFDSAEKILMIKYQGACGTCPSSTMGTLEAIKQILKDEIDEDIQVYIAPN